MNSFIEMFSTRMTNVKTFDNFYSRQKKYLSRQSLLKETMKLTQENEIKRNAHSLLIYHYLNRTEEVSQQRKTHLRNYMKKIEQEE